VVVTNTKLKTMIDRKPRQYKVYYWVTIQNQYRKYRTFVKEFNDYKHFENWYAFMCKNGNKVICTAEVDSIHSPMPQGF
jgi:spore coat polysaccharide biosynthesis protein SpsF (cytidylyltransferase family)